MFVNKDLYLNTLSQVVFFAVYRFYSFIVHNNNILVGRLTIYLPAEYCRQ